MAMKRICESDKCCGCMSCYSACKKGAIKADQNENGFIVPKIDESSCADCGVCNTVCPVVSKTKKEYLQKGYACFNNNAETVNLSSSGGVFTLIADEIIKRGGVVFGAAFDEDFSVHHIFVDNLEDLEKLRGSKYLQSKIGDSFKKAKEFLENGRPVLFTGMPCQINGLKAFLKKDYDNLFLQDIVCHSAPSAKIWQIYIRHREKAEGSKLVSVSFREKSQSWQKYNMSMRFENGSEYKIEGRQDPYMKAFIKGLSVNKACSACRFKTGNRAADITLADFWGIEKICPEMYNINGTSLVTVNSPKGEKMFELIKNNMTVKSVDVLAALAYNTAALNPVLLNPHRDEFFAKVNEDNFERLVKKFTPVPLKQRLSNTVVLRGIRRVKRTLTNKG